MIHIGIPIGMEEVPKEMSLDRIMKTKMVGWSKTCQYAEKEHSKPLANKTS